MKSMRLSLAAGAVVLAVSSITAIPAQAQGGAFMWCQATADNGADTTVYYSAFFSAGAWEADRKALAFKSEVEDAEVSASSVTAKCMAPADYDAAVAARNAAMKAAPGTVLSWEG
jgi:hypothetical protein